MAVAVRVSVGGRARDSTSADEARKTHASYECRTVCRTRKLYDGYDAGTVALGRRKVSWRARVW